MGRGRLGSQQGMARTMAARQVTAAAVSASPADIIRESLRSSGTMDLAAFSKLSDDDMAAILAEIDQYETDDELKGRLLRPTDTQRFFNQIGWTDEKPTVLSDSAYEKARQALGTRSLYHTDAPYGSLSTKTMLDQFRKGTQYLSGGVHGDGTYLAEDAYDSWTYGNGVSTARQQKMFFNKNAKVVSERNLYNQFRAWQQTHPKAYDALSRMSQGYRGKFSTRTGTAGSISVFAAMMGYNVIKSADYYTVLNRKAVTVARSHKVYGNGSDTRNW